MTRLLHELLSGHVRPAGCAGGATLTESTVRLQDIEETSQALGEADPASVAPPLNIITGVMRCLRVGRPARDARFDLVHVYAVGECPTCHAHPGGHTGKYPVFDMCARLPPHGSFIPLYSCRVHRSRVLPIVVAVITAWFLIVLLFWAVRPSTGMVQVGTDYTTAPPQVVSVRVHCNSLFSNDSGGGGAIPELPRQPEERPQLALPQQPCSGIHADARRAFVIDSLVFVIVLAGCAATFIYRRRSPTERRPAIEDAEQVSEELRAQ